MPQISSAKASASPSSRKAKSMPSAGTQGIASSGISPRATAGTKPANQAVATAAPIAGSSRHAPASVDAVVSGTDSAKTVLAVVPPPRGRRLAAPARPEPAGAPFPSYGTGGVNQPLPAAAGRRARTRESTIAGSRRGLAVKWLKRRMFWSMEGVWNAYGTRMADFGLRGRSGPRRRGRVLAPGAEELEHHRRGPGEAAPAERGAGQRVVVFGEAAGADQLERGGGDAVGRWRSRRRRARPSAIR